MARHAVPLALVLCFAAYCLLLTAYPEPNMVQSFPAFLASPALLLLTFPARFAFLAYYLNTSPNSAECCTTSIPIL